MDTVILRKFLKCGFMEKGKVYPTLAGTPQGGVISPALAVMTLSELEGIVRSYKEKQRDKEKINMIAYADDFIVTAASKELLIHKVIPLLKGELAKVGLELSEEKTKITHIEDGFDFLGFNVRKYKNEKVLIKPAKANIKRFLKEIRFLIKRGTALPTDKLIYALNTKIVGFANYYRSSVASEIFSKIDHEIFKALWRWALKRHARKGKWWISRHYFTTLGGDNWRFFCTIKDKEGKPKKLYLKNASETKIRRHVKIKSEANPFDPAYKEYFAKRDKDRLIRKSICNLERTAGLRIIQPY